jgi:hypothetical protein
MVVFVCVGLLLDLLLVGFFWAGLVAVLWHFSKPGLRHCPACQRDGLELFVATATLPGRLTLYRCVHCNAGFRVQLDGTLAAMEPS